MNMKQYHNKKKYNAIGFDVGNVLTHFHLDKFLERVNANEKNLKSFEHLKNPLKFLEKIQHSNDLGIINLKKELSHLHDLHLSEERIDQIVNLWNEILVLEPKMTNLVKSIKPDFEIIIMSNMGEEHYEHLYRQDYDLFNKTMEHFSFQVGARKPQINYYQSLIMRRPNWHSEAILFIDDRPENLKIAEHLGFDTLKFNLSESFKNNTLDSDIEKLKKTIYNSED